MLLLDSPPAGMFLNLSIMTRKMPMPTKIELPNHREMPGLW
jgi:hypothetical protein